MNIIFWKLTYLSKTKTKKQKKKKRYYEKNYESLIFKSKGNGDLYWTYVETNNHISQFSESDSCNSSLKLI